MIKIESNKIIVVSFPILFIKNYIGIYIDKNLYTKPDYAERLKELNSKADCKIIVVENDISSKTETVDSSEWNILDMVENTIPDFLKNKFKKILSEL